jgi:hypothetical protein
MRAEGPRKFLNLDCAVSEMPFPGLWERFDRILMVRKQRFSMSKFAICLQLSSTKWAKAYLINYILDKLQFVMDNVVRPCITMLTRYRECLFY